ncbi:hypothetical protein AB1N83_014467 [Pleurotus pulmonarius]
MSAEISQDVSATMTEPSKALVVETPCEITGGSLTTMAPIVLYRPRRYHLESSTETAPLLALWGEPLDDIFNTLNALTITPALVHMGHPGVLFLDGLIDPRIKEALGEEAQLSRTTNAFFTEIRIFYPACDVNPITIETILEPFEGQLHVIPTRGLLSMESLVFDPRTYGFGAIAGYFSRTSDGYYVKIVIRFNKRETRGKGHRVVERKLFVAAWVHRDHVSLGTEDRRLLQLDSLILSKPDFVKVPLSTRYVTLIFP